MAKKKRKNVSSDPYETTYGDPYGADPYDTAYGTQPGASGSSGDPYDDPYGYHDTYDTSTTGKKKKKKKGSGGALKAIAAIVVIIALIAALATGIATITGPTKGQCKDTIETAEYALNNMDVNSFCDVITPSTGRKIKAAIMLLGVLSETDAAQYLESAIGQLGTGLLPTDGMDAGDFLKGIEIEPYKFSFPGKTRTVECRLNYNGSTYAKVAFEIKKTKDGGDRVVYIHKIKTVN